MRKEKKMGKPKRKRGETKREAKTRLRTSHAPLSAAEVAKRLVEAGARLDTEAIAAEGQEALDATDENRVPFAGGLIDEDTQNTRSEES